MRILLDRLFYAAGVLAACFVLGIFLVAFFLKHVRGTALFWSALAAEVLIITLFFLRPVFPALNFSYLWYNVIGCTACVVFSLVLQAVLGGRPRSEPAAHA